MREFMIGYLIVTTISFIWLLVIIKNAPTMNEHTGEIEKE